MWSPWVAWLTSNRFSTSFHMLCIISLSNWHRSLWSASWAHAMSSAAVEPRHYPSHNPTRYLSVSYQTISEVVLWGFHTRFDDWTDVHVGKTFHYGKAGGPRLDDKSVLVCPPAGSAITIHLARVPISLFFVWPEVFQEIFPRIFCIHFSVPLPNHVSQLIASFYEGRSESNASYLSPGKLQ